MSPVAFHGCPPTLIAEVVTRALFWEEMYSKRRVSLQERTRGTSRKDSSRLGTHWTCALSIFQVSRGGRGGGARTWCVHNQTCAPLPSRTRGWRGLQAVTSSLVRQRALHGRTILKEIGETDRCGGLWTYLQAFYV